MDTCFKLIEEKKLGVWDSIQALNQTAGRGQMRKHWLSLEGNIMVSLLLPSVYPFNSTCAAVAFGGLCAAALNCMGFPVFLKWPNDIVIKMDDEMFKAGGILLEERDNFVVAGLGLNIGKAPRSPLPDAIMPAGYLAQVFPDVRGADPVKLWKNIFVKMVNLYEETPPYAQRWKQITEHFLVCIGKVVRWEDGRNSIRGVLYGLSDSGGALLDTGATIEDKTSGGFRIWTEN